MKNLDLTVTLSSLHDIQAIQSIDQVSEADWGNPDWFFNESLKQNRAFIAYNGNSPIGYLIYQVLWGNTPFLALLKVIPEFQRQKVGSNLIDSLEKHLLELGFESYLTSSEQVNNFTKGFFKKHSFSPIGTLDMTHGKEIFYLKSLR